MSIRDVEVVDDSLRVVERIGGIKGLHSFDESVDGTLINSPYFPSNLATVYFLTGLSEKTGKSTGILFCAEQWRSARPHGRNTTAYDG